MATGSGVYTDATARAGVNWTAAGGADDGTCSATVCHNNDNTGAPVGTTRAWNVAYTPADNCLMCHANGVDAVADAAGADSVDDQWATKGHGSAAGGTLGNNPAGNASSAIGGCDFCHLADVWQEHVPAKVGTNPYRLRTAPTGNTVCLACHQTADAGFDAPGGSVNAVNSTLNVDQTHNGAKHQALEGGQFCWDCHEAHGGSATNILMVKDFMSIASDTYGVPMTTDDDGGGVHGAGGGDGLRGHDGADGGHGGDLPEVPREQGGAGHEVLALRRDGRRGPGQRERRGDQRHEPAQPDADVHELPPAHEPVRGLVHGLPRDDGEQLLPGRRCAERDRGAEPGGQARGARGADRGGERARVDGELERRAPGATRTGRTRGTRGTRRRSRRSCTTGWRRSSRRSTT